MSQSRLIGLLDCNSFFASCEKLFRPDLKDKAVVVLSNNDGVVVSRSPEAKKLVPMGEPHYKIKHIAERGQVIVFSSNYRLYGDMSNRVMKTLQQWTPHVEIYSIDEAFLDLTNHNNTSVDKQFLIPAIRRDRDSGFCCWNKQLHTASIWHTLVVCSSILALVKKQNN